MKGPREKLTWGDFLQYAWAVILVLIVFIFIMHGEIGQ